MGIILSLVSVAVKPVVYDCGRLVDNSTDRIHDGSERERKRDQRTREEERDAEGRSKLANLLSEGTGSAAVRRVEADGDASGTVTIVALVAHATSIQPDALQCKPLSRYFVDLSQKVLSPGVAGGCA